jgi:hypothetical protein
MMFRFAYPVMFVLLAGVVGWMLYIFWKKPVGVTHSITGRLAELAGRRSGARQLVLPAQRGAAARSAGGAGRMPHIAGLNGCAAAGLQCFA